MLSVKKSKLMKIGIIVMSVFLFAFIVWRLLFVISVSRRFVRKCYFSNKDAFGEITLGMKEVYDGEMFCAKLDRINPERRAKIQIFYKIIREEDEVMASKEADFINESCVAALDGLREEYQSYSSNYPIFSSIEAYYDAEGNMLLALQVKKNLLKDSESVFCYYLIYVEDEYKGKSPFQIDKMIDKPIAEHWYIWTKRIPLG